MELTRRPPTTLAPPMGRSRRCGAAIVVFLCVLMTLADARPAAAQTPPGSDLWLVDGPRFEPLDRAPLSVGGVGEYRGSIRLSRRGGGLAVVNHVAIDEYLRGISEVPASWPIEAQKAQAIAARTYALHETTRTTNAAYKNVGADICATDSCQVYAGVAKERRPGSEAWIAAVEQTKGLVLTYKGAPIVAKYSSSNGGEVVSGGQPYLRAGPDPDDAYSPLHQWRATYGISEVARVTGLAAEPTALRREGDDVVATYVDALGLPIEQRVAAADFRSRLNNGVGTPAGLPLPVPSIRFDVAVADGLVHVDGRGWGHGIGLSQYGALGKALRGLKAPDILAAYYAGLRPMRVPDGQLADTVRVAIALDRTEATVGSTGAFRILDAGGNVIAHRATGTWSTRPGPDGRIRVVPPADQTVAPAAVLRQSDPATLRPGRAVAAGLELTGPSAVTTISLVTPDGASRQLDAARLRLPGPLTVRLASSTTAAPGRYLIVIDQDAGRGRTASTTLPLDVAAPALADAATAPPTAPSSPSGSAGTSPKLMAGVVPAGVLEGLATVLFLAVAVAGALWVGRRPGLELH